MICEAKLSNIKIGLSEAELNEITETISSLYPKYKVAESCYGELHTIMLKDKKNHAGKINCTLLASIGECKIDNVCTEDELFESIRYYSGL